jgi:hypothetical protein
MVRQVVGVLLGAVLIIALEGMPAYAQDVTARIPFEFRAGEAVLPAETYTISYSEANPWTLAFRGTDGSKHEVRIITRLAQKETPSLDTYLVFDKIGNVYLFSEFWLPAMDGFFLGGDPLTHTHVIVKAKVQKEILP